MLSKTLIPNKLTLDFILTLVTSILTVLGVLFINAYVSRVHGIEILGEYLLVWRFITSLAGVFLIGMNISLPFFLPRDDESSVINTAFIIFQTISIPILILLAYCAYLGIIPGINPNNSIAYFVFSLGIILKVVIYSYFRGIIKMVKANLLQIITIFFIPIISILIFHKINQIFYSIGFLMIIFTIIFFLYHRKNIPKYKFDYKEFKKIVHYGANRLFGTLGESFLIAGIPILLVRNISYSQLAYFNSSLSVIRIFLVIVGPIGVILLPRISKALDINNIQQVRHGIEILIKVSIIFGSTIGIFLVLYGNTLLQFWLGTSDLSGLNNINFIFLSIPFYIIFKTLNSPINAVSTRGYISVIYVFTAVVLYTSYKLLLLFGFQYIESGIISIIISYFIASIFSLIIIKLKLNVKIIHISTIIHLIVINLFQIVLYIFNAYFFKSVVLQLLLQITLLITFISVYFTIKRNSWIKELKAILFKKNNKIA